MEKFRSCPICFEVPQQEIFQCTAGHMICSICITKVDKDLCPQCRIPFGNPKIRNRILEEILDAQEFQCKFSEKGCTHLCKRGELTKHDNSCSHNPDLIPLCKQIGILWCKFKFPCISRADIISHFSRHHNIDCICKQGPELTLKFEGSSLMELFSRKRKVEDTRLFKSTNYLVSIGSSEDGPLLLLSIRMNFEALSVSFGMVKVWESTFTPPANYSAQFKIHKGNSTLGGSGCSFSSTNEIPNPYPLIWQMKVSSLKEAHQVLNWNLMSLPVSMLRETQFGSSSGDSLKVNILRAN